MLAILENFLSNGGFNYRRMDGLTHVKEQMALIDELNYTDDSILILTTKARERTWLIGQKKVVIIYRLITRETIGEKVYHRRIYKHFLTNKILKNPQQRRFFKSRDMKDLFTLNEDGDVVVGFSQCPKVNHFVDHSQLMYLECIHGRKLDTQRVNRKHNTIAKKRR